MKCDYKINGGVVSLSSVHQAANAAVRNLLIDFGIVFEALVGNVLYTDSSTDRTVLLTDFNHRCCYCEKKLTIDTMEKDHLIPMNKTYVGLHAWGNLVPACHSCNSKKSGKEWMSFLLGKCGGKKGKVFTRRHNMIIDHVNKYGYDQLTTTNIRKISQLANDLHRDVVLSLNQIHDKYQRNMYKPFL
ncbi:HNH endonuclease [Domibacillus sp. PGB-M46]|uniref:HNH endonuclease n=1 Tax=Domibacillus sp. PGB-M46 TaxID=2910255 RepID=UPI001F594181|nr:HNH endonuclease [Domibacillus sp. PGB-M46]MCI2254553.1 HNH endonuclease [Domibacillus sp. PGB-M46]